jgi:hypothetical protein
MDNIKIVRLQSGEDIIANYLEKEEEGTVLLSKPMTLLFKRLPTGKAVMLMSPWLPLELVESDSAWLYSQDILSVFQPKESLIDYYNNTVKEVEEEMIMSESDIEDSLRENSSIENIEEMFGPSDEIEDEEGEEELRQEMEALRKDVKKRLLH